ncbi:NADH:ubiquinone oxidoreductase 13 kDa subunit [Dunaliella salina]|uniref:NADH:ubiquinone oxidoreductase 13 kDa subunit n=1 Tax=Dunaliella salina TaxID=3046 RepID=A0ABQ7G870_DUNSA|nr:NADH:ubiquinone oxidoreductase 13 kDa subunit [Dunaliella salina]|eukprot:KAF5830802.1 NADH:ubiquinone oxidoreductase 13 kDa subunit [Dunaliella salina]
MSSFRGLAHQLIKGVPSAAATRGLQSESASTRYSPTPFSRTAPLDCSSTWLPKNPFYESWVHKREMLHNEFTWNLRNTVEVSYYLVGLSVGAFAFGTWTLNSTDAINGYPKRDMVFSGPKSGFILPDEREW